MTRFETAIAAIDAVNAEDPNLVDVAGALRPAELVYGERMTAVLGELYPEASELLALAARAQHIRRWAVPRSSYPEGRAGYHRWRNDLKVKHAEWTGEILRRCSYSEAEAGRAAALVAKQNLATDPEAQALEDVACIVFLRFEAATFAEGHSDEKLAGILAKTFAKMSEKGRSAALKVQLPARLAWLMGAVLTGAAVPERQQ